METYVPDGDGERRRRLDRVPDPLKSMRTGVAWIGGAAVFIAMLMSALVLPLFMNLRDWDAWARTLARALVSCFGMKVELRGEPPEKENRGSIIVCNHVNFLDGFLLYGYFPLFFRVLEQKEHFSWPVWGWFSRRIGNIPLDQSGGGATAVALLEARRALDEGTSILIFPEAHRTRDGRIAAFHRGAFRLARSCRATLRPLVMCGAWEGYRRGGGGVLPGKIELAILPPWHQGRIEAEGETAARDRILDEMRTALDEGRGRITPPNRDRRR